MEEEVLQRMVERELEQVLEEEKVLEEVEEVLEEVEKEDGEEEEVEQEEEGVEEREAMCLCCSQASVKCKLAKLNKLGQFSQC